MTVSFSKHDSQEQMDVAIEEKIKPGHRIIIYNDDVNTFDHVISSLVEVCDHTEMQAEQCSLLIHFKGKCDVKSGDFEKLRPLCEALLDRGLNAEIE